MKKASIVIFALTIISFNIQAQKVYNKDNLSNQLSELSSLGVQYKFIGENIIELSDTITGWKTTKTFQETSTETIYNWANDQGIPVIDINPTLVDTNKWSGWYNYWTFVPVSNWFGGIPTKVGDFDGDGFPEVYGFFGYVGDVENRVFEVYPDGSSIQMYSNNPNPGGSTNILDIDKNGLLDVVFLRGQNSYVYEQPNVKSLPTQSKFTFTKYDGLGAYLSREQMAYMDGDSLIDFVHRGADTSVSPYYLMYVSEYNPSIQNFEKKWYIEPTDDFYDGFDIGDYDGDKQMEFTFSSLWGKIRVVENTGDDMYAVNFIDSLPLVNMYYQTSGDVDCDGKREFFIGATMGDGNWTVMYETDGDNIYSPRVMLHLISGGSLDEPTYITDDIDGDGKLELAILSGGYLYIFKSDSDDSYFLWYLKQGPSNMIISFYDMDGDGIKDILWGIERQSNLVSNIYKGSLLVNVENEKPLLPGRLDLLQNYPNPFNPGTSIVYKIDSYGLVTLKVFDVLGREISTIVNEEKEIGSYTVRWDATDFPSGVYFYKLQTETGSITKKMLLVR